MLTFDPLFKKSLKIGLLGALYTGISGLGGIWVSRQIGAADRGILAKMLLIFVGLGIITELGVLSAATYFASTMPETIEIVLKTIHRSLTMNIFYLGIPVVMCLIFLKIVVINYLILILVVISIGNFFAGPLHVLQGLDIELWRKVQFSQIFGYILLFLLFSLKKIELWEAFILISCPSIFSSMIARFKLSKYINTEGVSCEKKILEIKSSVKKYSFSAFAWILLTELSSRWDLIVVSCTVSNIILGNYALILSWLLISSPLINAIGNVAFPQVAKDMKDRIFTTIQFLKYLKYTFIITSVLTLILIYLMPFTLNRFMANTYKLYPHYATLLGPFIMVKHLNYVLSEITRGLNRTKFYLKTQTVILLVSCLYFILIRPVDIFKIITVLFITSLLSFLINVIYVYKYLEEVNGK